MSLKIFPPVYKARAKNDEVKYITDLHYVVCMTVMPSEHILLGCFYFFARSLNLVAFCSLKNVQALLEP